MTIVRLGRRYLLILPLIMLILVSLSLMSANAPALAELESVLLNSVLLNSTASGYPESISIGQQTESTTAQSVSNAASELAHAHIIEPTNPFFSRGAIKIHVESAGMQQIRGADLMELGIEEGTMLAAAAIQHRGTVIAIDIDDVDGLLDESTVLRFYAPHREHSMRVGDDWNSEDIYWLSAEVASGVDDRLRMTTRSVVPEIIIDDPGPVPIPDPIPGPGPGPEPEPLPDPFRRAQAADEGIRLGTAPIGERTTGFQSGIWESNRYYRSETIGYDGDQFFTTDLKTEVPSLDPTLAPSVTINISSTLPLNAFNVSDNSIFTFSGASRTVATHTAQVRFGNRSVTGTWQTTERFGSWTFSIETPTVADRFNFQMVPGAATSYTYFDKLYWTQPVQLIFDGNGAAFSGAEGYWYYQMTGIAEKAVLYDVTDPVQPQKLVMPEGPNIRILDGPKPRNYLLVAENNLQQPKLSLHSADTFAGTQGASAIYIAPLEFHAQLEPLIELRRAQGVSAIVIDPERIYNAWSYGYTSPEAIRTFLQFAAESWNPQPIAAILVGDTTHDPLNYLGKRNGTANYNHVPTYMEKVDTVLGTTACDNCFVQLDGAHPLDADADPDFGLEMWIGRLPVQTEVYLTNLVNKIIAYETASDINADWRNTSLFVADNMVRLNCVADTGGDYAAMADEVITDWQSSEVNSERIYYDPSSRLPQTCEFYAPQADPWREADPDEANRKVIDQINEGAGLVTFVGSSNYGHLGPVEDPDATTRYLFEYGDVPELANEGQPFIGLRMSSYTSRFAFVMSNGQVLDERLLLLPEGGAIATWGSSGLIKPVETMPLMKGFHQALWDAPEMNARLGELVAAGYTQLLADESCCSTMQYTYTLLGDPLTRARIGALGTLPPTDVPTPTPEPSETPVATNTPMETETPTITVTPPVTPTGDSTPIPTVTNVGTNTPTPVVTPQPTSDPTPNPTPLPDTALLSASHNSGAPGSYFVIVGSEYNPGEAVEVRINGAIVTTVMADDSGEFMLLFETDNIAEGFYEISAVQAGVSGSAGATATLQIQLDDTANTHASPVSPDDPNITLITMQQHTYLPLLQ